MCIFEVCLKSYLVWKVTETLVDWALSPDGSRNHSAFLALLKPLKCSFLLSLLASAAHNYQTLTFEQGFFEEVKFFFRRLFSQMILVELCQRLILISRHFHFNSSEISFVRIKIMVILLDLLIKFMGKHLDTREVHDLLHWLLIWSHLLRRVINWSTTSHRLLPRHLLSCTWWVRNSLAI